MPDQFGWIVRTASGQSLPPICREEVLWDGESVSRGEIDMHFPGLYAVGTAPGESAAIQRVIAQPHSGTAQMHIDCGEAGAGTWSTPLTVYPASVRETGVSINDGADYTNSPDVRLFLGWRHLTGKVKISNDGGFAPSRSQTFDLTSSDPMPRRLVNLRNERLPKTVYVRFKPIIGDWETETYTDDIILDTVVPEILSLSISDTGNLAVVHRAVQVRAKDNKSGITSIQVAKNRPNRHTKILKFRKSVPAPRSGRVFVRVRDGAGNWSAWKSEG